MGLTLTISQSTGEIDFFNSTGTLTARMFADESGNVYFTPVGNGQLYLGNNGIIVNNDGSLAIPQYQDNDLQLPGLVGGVLEVDEEGNLQVSGRLNTTAAGFNNPINVTFGGDFQGTFALDGMSDVSFDVTLANIITNGNTGPFTGFKIDAKGRVTAAYNYTTIADYGLTDALTSQFVDSSGDLYFSLPPTAYYTQSAQTTGLIQLKLPVRWNGSRITATLQVVEAKTGKQCRVTASGLLDSTNNTWSNTSANVTGDSSIVNTVQFAHDGLSAYILLSNTALAYNGLSVLLESVLVGAANQTQLKTGYAINLIANASSLTIDANPALNANANAQLLNSKPASFYSDWNNLQNRPTTLAGYGITDALNVTEGGQIFGSVQIGVQAGLQTLCVPNGSAASPSIYAIGDTTTGLSFGLTRVNLSSAGVIGFEQLGSHTFRYGVSDLATALTVQTGINSGTQIRGSAITQGGAWPVGVGTNIQTAGTGAANGANSLVFSYNDAEGRFLFKYLPNTNGAAYLATPTSLFEVWGPQDSDVAVNFVRVTGSVINNAPVISAAGLDDNVNLQLIGKGTGSVLINSDAAFDGGMLTGDANQHIIRFGTYVTVNPLTRFSIHPINVDAQATGDILNTFPSIHLLSPEMNFVETAVETGIRTGLQLDWLVSDINFFGTLQEQRALWVRHGNYDLSASGIIENSYGVYIDMPGGGMATTINSWGLYQTSVYTATQNFLHSPIIFGGVAAGLETNEQLLVQGNARVAGQLTVSNTAIFNAGTQSIGAHKESAGNPLIVSYRNVADFYEASSGITGTLKITLPFGWSNTALMFKIILSFLYDLPSVELTVTGNNQSLIIPGDGEGPWNNTAASALGDVPGNSVRLGFDGSHCCILIGTLSTIWNWPTVLVKEVIAAYDNTDGWGSGYQIGIISNEAGITNIKQVTLTTGSSGGSSGNGGGSSTPIKQNIGTFHSRKTCC